jgi:hypothetical protein
MKNTIVSDLDYCLSLCRNHDAATTRGEDVPAYLLARAEDHEDDGTATRSISAAAAYAKRGDYASAIEVLGAERGARR